MSSKNVTALAVIDALNKITGGRIPLPGTPLVPGSHPFIVEKSSGIPGKAVLEIPGLLVGKPDKPISSIGVGMTLTESMIELAGSIGLDAIITHHPVADAANSGGVPLKPYLELYNLALFELHEAFHGLHPGIACMHGHRVLEKDIHYGGIPGNVLLYGQALPGIANAGDILKRLNSFINLETEKRMLAAEAEIRASTGICETTLSARPKIMCGETGAPVQFVLHIFPHTGFTSKHLESALASYPMTDTIIASISRVLPNDRLTRSIRDKGLTFIIGSSHSQEIYENGLPLAYALKHELPEVSVTMLRERVTATPLENFGSESIQEYARQMAGYLIHDGKGP